MRDEETGSWWQQVTGEAILGPLKGSKLKQAFHDEISFQVWKQEQPNGRVLQPNDEIVRKNKYAKADWEQKMAAVPVTTSAAIDNTIEPRRLIVGVELNGESKAYPLDALIKQRLILDDLGGVPIFIVVGDDLKSVRAYRRTVSDRKLEFFVKTDATPQTLVDAETGSEWNFAGLAIAGPLSGKQLTRVAVLNDYWFDWKTYHPKTFVYDLGNR